MHHDKERVLLALIKIGRQCDHVVNAFACFAGEPEVTQRLPVDLCHLIGVERVSGAAFSISNPAGRFQAD